MAYPDYGGGAAYGDAYEQGAGFYAAGAENESPNKGARVAKVASLFSPSLFAKLTFSCAKLAAKEVSLSMYKPNTTLICSHVSVEF